MRAQTVNFERGQDPKTSMGIGKAARNPFMNGTFRSWPFSRYISLKDPNDPSNIKWEFLKKAAELLGVEEQQVLVAVDVKNRHLDEYDLVARDLDIWENSGKEAEINDEYFLTLGVDGVVYVTKTEEGIEYILGENI